MTVNTVVLDVLKEPVFASQGSLTTHWQDALFHSQTSHNMFTPHIPTAIHLELSHRYPVTTHRLIKESKVKSGRYRNLKYFWLLLVLLFTITFQAFWILNYISAIKLSCSLISLGFTRNALWTIHRMYWRKYLLKWRLFMSTGISARRLTKCFKFFPVFLLTL